MTSHHAPVLLLSCDEELHQRLHRSLRAPLQLLCLEEWPAFREQASRTGPCVVLLDLRLPPGSPELAGVLAAFPQHAWIVLGVPRSDPLLAPALDAAYAVEDLACEGRQLARTIRQAQAHLALLAECNELRREKNISLQPGPPPLAHPVVHHESISINEIAGISRCLGNVDAMLSRLLEEVATSHRLTCAGIVVREKPGQDYRVRAGWLLPEGLRALRYARDDAFVLWLDRHPHLLDRRALGQIPDTPTRLQIQAVMNQLDAELLFPLRGRSGLLGWLFVGYSADGSPFDPHHIHELLGVADITSVLLENALLHHETVVQKHVAESLLHALPMGVLFVDETGRIQWFNAAAAQILDSQAHAVLHQPVETLGPRFADVARRSLAGTVHPASLRWTDPATRRPLQVACLRLGDSQACIGTLLMVQDLTQQNALQEQQARVERTAFWQDLASSMSHEVRNPLVAIHTFAQLLPERYDDPEFREQFRTLVLQEVERLNAIVNQINDFAHPRELVKKPLDIRHPLRRALEQVQAGLNGNGPVAFDCTLPDKLPPVLADETALYDSFLHLLNNAVAAVANCPNARICIAAAPPGPAPEPPRLQVRITDNGRGIPPGIYDKVFSPFCTTKARGIGLGLPIVQRIITDHQGKIELQSGAQGTAVTLLFPIEEKEPCA